MSEINVEHAPMRYAILEGNMERLAKKMARIQKKCEKYGGEFRFEIVGEEFRELKAKSDDGKPITAKFFIVEAEGVAIVNDWRFIASVEHTSAGNIIRGVTGVEVPERYYTGAPVCEHCKSRRTRKDTYIVQNIETGEFKQVGKSCLRDFTRGMDAKFVAQYLDAMEHLVAGEAPGEGFRIEFYIDTNEWLRYVAETVRHFGYVKRNTYENQQPVISTADRAEIFYRIDHGIDARWLTEKERRQFTDEMEQCNFSSESKEAAATVKSALEWLSAQEEVDNYTHNLKTACQLKYLGRKHFGLAASLLPSYNRGLVRQEKEREKEKKAASEAVTSQWVSEVGKRVDIAVSEMTCITGWDTEFGYTRLYKIVDGSGNIYIWKTSSYVEDKVSSIRGTVKAHSDYKGVKQTVLTRCRCIA